MLDLSLDASWVQSANEIQESDNGHFTHSPVTGKEIYIKNFVHFIKKYCEYIKIIMTELRLILTQLKFSGKLLDYCKK